MKIAAVLDDTMNSNNGVQQIVRALGQYWSSVGHEVHYIAGAGSPPQPRLHQVGRTATVRFNGNRISTPTWANRKRILQLLAEQQYDVLHVHAPYGPIIGHPTILAAAPTTAVVASFHMAALRSHVEQGVKVLGWLTRRSRVRLDSITCDSTASSDLLASAWGVSAPIVGNPIDLSRFHPAESHSATGTTNLIFVGRLVERKGCADLLRALALIPLGRRQSIRLTVVGDGPLRVSLEKLVAGLNLGSICRFTGRLTETLKVDLLQAADLAIFPSHGGESFGVVLLEAIGCGVPAVGYANGGYRYVLGADSVALVEPGNIVKLAALISRLSENRDERRSLWRAQRTLTKQYSLPLIGGQYLDLFESLVQQRQNRSGSAPKEDPLGRSRRLTG